MTATTATLISTTMNKPQAPITSTATVKATNIKSDDDNTNTNKTTSNTNQRNSNAINVYLLCCRLELFCWCACDRIVMTLLMRKVLLAMVAAYGRPFRLQMLTNKSQRHWRTQVTAAELFFLRHLRSCAASASGKSSTASGATSNIYKSRDCVILEAFMSAAASVLENTLQVLSSAWIALKYILKLLWQTTHWIFTCAWTLLQYTQELVPYSSPLEMVACLAVLETSGVEYQRMQTVLGPLVLLLALCDWHVPSIMPYNYIVCRLMSVFILHCILKLLWRTTQRILTCMWTLLQYTRKLVPYLSPLEMVACGVILDEIEVECQSVQTVLAVSILFLAQCDCHVPSIIPYGYIVCKLFSAICMYSFYPTSITLICWAFAHPTFGKKAQATSASASQDPVAAAGVSENAPACPNDKTSLDDIIAKFQAMG